MNSQSQANIVSQFQFMPRIFQSPSHALTENTPIHPIFHLCNQLNNTSSFSDLPLGLLAEPSCAHDEGNFGKSAFAQNFAVSEGEEVEDGDSVFLGAFGEVAVALLGGD
jgi:hypothetical protein